MPIRPTTGASAFDRSWNLIRLGPWQYFPYDSTSGIQTPLTVGKTWTYQFKSVNAGSGFTWNRSGSSKVVGQETVTTKAGTFETFRIETTASGSEFRDPTATEEMTLQTWYAPAIGHWVKRSRIIRSSNHLAVNNTSEIVEFGRK